MTEFEEYWLLREKHLLLGNLSTLRPAKVGELDELAGSVEIIRRDVESTSCAVDDKTQEAFSLWRIV